MIQLSEDDLDKLRRTRWRVAVEYEAENLPRSAGELMLWLQDAVCSIPENHRRNAEIRFTLSISPAGPVPIVQVGYSSPETNVEVVERMKRDAHR